MTRFSDYLRCDGVDHEEREVLSERLHSWPDLHRWMEERDKPGCSPALRRAPTDTPHVDRSWKSALQRRIDKGRERADGRAPGWHKVVAYRQRISLVLTLITTAGTVHIADLMLRSQQMPEFARQLYLVIYGIMLFFLSTNFFKTMLGTWHAMRGAAGNPWHPQHTARDPRPDTRVAILFPVYHEDVTRLAAGIAATWQSLATKHPGLADRFDVFLLSDSRLLEYAIAEEACLHRLRESFPQARFFYRRRPMNQNAKMGNISDFCRRWGSAYDYMLVMDADSVMDGDAIVPMLRMMEGNDRLGILQTNPTPILRTSLFGRMQQFSSRLYGSVFSYSLQAMYMGNASYIGHNALIRIAPFMTHCMLARLPGQAPWGGKPLSHDIVESAMMARAGFEVWFLPELAGSYEELPANVLAHMIRERRWMQGNLQHLRLLFVEGLRSIHRETFITGSMGYLAAPLWAAFLLVSGYGMFHFLETGVMALSGIQMLEMPMMMLFLSSIIFLFLPRLLALAIHIASDRARAFGGKDKLVWSILLETAFSLIFSPVQMIVITRFLWLWVKRRTVTWGTQVRGDAPLPWRSCLMHFGWISVIGAVGLAVVMWRISQVPAVGRALLLAASGGWLNASDMIIWLFPVLIGLAGSVFTARLSSFTFPALTRARIFAIPEEVFPPDVVRNVHLWEAHFRAQLPDPSIAAATLAYAQRDTQFYMWHRRETRVRARVADALLPKIASHGELTAVEMRQALAERQCFDALHLRATVSA